MEFPKDIEAIRVECARLTSRQRLAVTCLCATKVQPAYMEFCFSQGEGEKFYRINNGLDAVWRELRGIQQASVSDVRQIREEAMSYVARLDDAGGEAAVFAGDAISLSVSAMSSFLEDDSEAAANSVLLGAEISSDIASFLAEHQGAEGEYFLNGDKAWDVFVAEFVTDVKFLNGFPAADFPATRFMGRAGAASVRLTEQMSLVLNV